ncbi:MULTISPECIES: DUF3558 domain-containing protein [unclassified Crossiella]|uniref:DUF3558 domain-containing protein n=1 Tax=unclassified Crossiella TaxID=2620835 RepID=UPI001FFEB7A1|nr:MULTISPECIES: DUF3558 domain-containing protein [unclassified Crossiella]MCK2240955.1 DUF3558 domain-containing protein [Crossiella sp. S99.2]MCK2253901.1 DUF3558 domain-containing protein [Crossiella sp. S99.1]
MRTGSPRAPLRALSLVAALVLVAGCTVSVSGSAAGVDEDTGRSQARALLAHRPREIRVDGVTREQVCALLTAAQQDALGLDYIRPAEAGDRYKNRGCGFSRSLKLPRYAYQVTPVPQEGADVWLRPGETNLEVKQIIVARFPAVQNRRRADGRGCFIDVSVADGQRLGIQYSHDTHPVLLTPVELCQRAVTVAEMVMGNLIAQRGGN